MNNSEYYILRRYYPYIDGFDDNEEIVYITKDYEDALKTAAWIHKADLERNGSNDEEDEDDDGIYSIITIESFNNENIYKQYNPPKEKDVLYCKTINMNISYDQLKKEHFYHLSSGSHDIFLAGDEEIVYANCTNVNNKFIPMLKDNMRILQVHYYQRHLATKFIVVKTNINELHDYDEQIRQLADEAIELLNNGEFLKDVTKFLYEMLDNTGLELKLN